MPTTSHNLYQYSLIKTDNDPVFPAISGSLGQGEPIRHQWETISPSNDAMECTGATQRLTKATTVQCHYNTVNFLQNPYKIHPIAGPSGRAMGCILLVQTHIYTLSQSLQRCIPYHVIFNCIITALDCVSCMPWLHPGSMHWHSQAWLIIISSRIISNNNSTTSSSKLEASRMVWPNLALLFWTMFTTFPLYDPLEMW